MRLQRHILIFDMEILRGKLRRIRFTLLLNLIYPIII